ncbi:MAG: hypothetical protein A2X86_07105 [Bdellovibrionales bacterium GWA2_49_15]|nr:MAG: hypothetical protein A2X86_07105 [Bdellovibrionales bacterium GWA2_49_15]HAZ11956.1 hypothetical protein [Bdellovibrionales bacterium]
MNLLILIGLFLLPGLAYGQIMKVGETLIHQETNYKITLTQIQKYESVCAVPGKNCGAGYIPGVQLIPHLKVEKDKKCASYPQPASCEVIHQIVSVDEKTVAIKFINIFELCEGNADLSNRYSCISMAVKNGPDAPPYLPKNCDRIKDEEVKAACYEAVADKTGDAKLCDLIKGRETYQCIYLRAKTKGDPEICKTLKRNRFHHSDDDHKGEIASCIQWSQRK